MALRRNRSSGALAFFGRESPGSPPPCILLTTFDDDAVVIEAIKLGARGFLLKDVSLDQLAEAVRTVASGGTLINPAVTERVARGLARLAIRVPASELPAALTRREIEVLRLMASGQSNREIARALGTAEATVKNQASSIFAKLGVRDRTRAVLRAIELDCCRRCSLASGAPRWTRAASARPSRARARSA